MILHPYKPIPWETFTVVPCRDPRRSRTPITTYVIVVAVLLAAIGMGLAAWNEGWVTNV